jgi:hypothetical protein
MDQDVRPATTAEVLERELKYAPTMIFTAEGGLQRITEPPVKPSPIQVSLMDEPPILITGLEWLDMAIAVKVDLMIEIGSPVEAVQAPEVLAAMPEDTRIWLTGWQQQVNQGTCWNTAGSIGRQAQELISEGFILLGKTSTPSFFGGSVPGRDDVRSGSPGSARFVHTMMGDAYLAWISSIE